MGSVYFSDPALLVLNVGSSSNKWSANNAAIPVEGADNMVVCDLDSDINWQPDNPMNDYRSIKEEFFLWWLTFIRTGRQSLFLFV
ncbi:hypothetical protein [Neptunomonas phycophila]|jgi:hypothetical protein|uniref:hypothetical protein n=1 Tax=Neptunomonas phycophila TaxID=1572645 RepID=UPI003513B307